MMIGLLLVSVLAFSQPEKGNPEEHLKRMNERMKTELELSDAQYDKVVVINEEMVFAMDEARQNKDREVGKEIRDNYREQLEGILTEEQMEKAKELFEKQKKRHHRGKHEND